LIGRTAAQRLGVRPVFDFHLKRTQVALADGRLDEAFELLKDPSLRAHRSGQKLLTRLSGAFVQRGQDHLSANRLASALEDCLRAEKLAGNVPNVVQLRAVIARRIECPSRHQLVFTQSPPGLCGCVIITSP